MQNPLSFYIVFNPMLNTNGLYQTQAHEFYFQLKQRIKQSNEDSSHMHWGKLKLNESSERQFSDFEKVMAHNREIGADTKLFITDYHHFWVAKVESVHSFLNDKSSTLAFYDNKDVSVWFRIVDMDLISAEFEETSHYLSQLYVENQFEPDSIEHLTPYVGGLRFPLIVQDKTPEDYFRNLYIEDTKRILRENALIEFPKDTEQLVNQMKSFVLPPHIFSKLSHQVKNEIYSAENIISKSDFLEEEVNKQVLDKYLRVLESTINETLGFVLREEFSDTLFVNKDGSKASDSISHNFVSLKDYSGNLKVELFIDLFKNNKMFGNISFDFLREKYPGLLEFLEDNLVDFILDHEIVAKRNSFQNGDFSVFCNKDVILSIRNTILGVGCQGVINTLIHHVFFAMGEQRFKSTG